MKTIVISPTNHKAIAFLEKLKIDKANAKAKAEARLAHKISIMEQDHHIPLND